MIGIARVRGTTLDFAGAGSHHHRPPRPPGPTNATKAGVLAALLLSAWSTLVTAAELQARVRDTDGNPVRDAVITATPVAASVAPVAPRDPVIISQQDKQFVPLVTVIGAGTTVSFPNNDDILHNVYSFSSAKKFDLPLYDNQSPATVLFDQPGTVILGCNIHDWMVAYVYVVQTPWFGKTGATGMTLLSGLPAGEYEVRMEHPRKRRRGSSPPQHVNLSTDRSASVAFMLALKPEWRQQRSGQ